MFESRAIPLPSMTPRASASVCSNFSVNAWSSPCVRRARSAAFLKCLCGYQASERGAPSSRRRVDGVDTDVYGIAASISAGDRASLKMATA